MKKNIFKNAFKIAGYYLIIGILWILFSDRLVAFFSNDPAAIINLETYKDWGFIIIISFLLFLLVYKYFLNLEKEKSSLNTAKSNLSYTEQKYKLLFEYCGEAILLTHPDGSIYKANSAACKIFNRTEDEIYAIGRNGLVDLNDPRFITALEERKKNGKFSGELNFIRKDGTIFPCEISSSVFIDFEGKEKTTMFIKDITDRKRAEKEINIANEELKTLNNIILKTIEEIGLKERLEHIMDEALKVVALEGGTICLINPDNTFNLSVHRETSQETIDDLSKHKIKIGECLCGYCAFGRKPLILNNRKEVLDFATREVLRGEDIRFHAAFPFVFNDRCLGVLCVFTRTDKKPAEKKLKFLETIVAQSSVLIENARLNEDLKESEEKFRDLYENAPAAYVSVNIDGCICRCNHKAVEMLGYKADKLIGMPVVELYADTPFGKEKAKMILNRFQAGDSVCDEELQMHRADESLLWISLTVSAIRNSQGKVLESRSMAVDITERKQVEEKLQRREKVFKLFIENSPASIAMFDNEMKYLAVSRRFIIDYELGQQELIGKSHYEIFPEISAKWKEIHKRCLAGAVEKCDEDLFYRASGKLDWVKWEILPWYERPNEIGGIILFSEVITERKQVEEELKISEKLFSDAFHVGPAGMTITRISDGKFIDVNESFLQMFEFRREEVIGHTSIELNMLGTEERIKLIEQQLASGGLHNAELIARSKSGRLLNLLFSSKQIELSGQACHITTLIDITVRKISENKLRESEKKFRSLVESINEVFYTSDSKGKIIYCSPSITNITGFEVEEIIGHSYLKLIEPADRRRVANHYIEQTKNSETDTTLEFRVQCKDGSIKWAGQITHLLRDNIGNIVEYRNVARDITELKQTEETLRESEERFHSMFLNHNAIMLLLEPATGRIVDANQSASKFYGYSINKLRQLNISDINMLTKEELAIRLKDVSMESRTYHNFPHKLSSGEIRFVEVYTSPIAIKESKVLFSIIHDITERKQAEQEVHETQEKLRALTAKLEKVKEEERINLSRELHDHLGQNLTGLKMDIAFLEKKIITCKAIEPDDLLSKTSGMINLIDELINNVRKISAELRPSVLDYLGLIPAIEWQMEEYNKRTQIECSFNSNILKIDLGTEVNSSIFRIVQEAFTNIIRHSHAKKAAVSINEEEDFFKMEITDDGIGIKENVISNLSSLGIIGMKERTLQFNGKLSLKNAPNGGTLLTLIIPKEEYNDKNSYRR